MSGQTADAKAASAPAPEATKSQNQRLDQLFAAHAVLAAVCGGAALLLPQLFGIFFRGDVHDELMRFTPGEGQMRLAHVVVRLYGAIILGQAPIAWFARCSTDANLRRGVVQAYFFVFVATVLVLVKALLTEDFWHASGWLNVFLFGGLCASYGWFSCFGPQSVFENVAKGMM
mmetsp:Transcript_61343/g.171676  ORF Transcript_61343/g.171676 Transcript_61343/m.171676 type:complete len:173 (-) Transcript_61343:111-629(-)